MYNTILDPNISLACNLLDACRMLDEKIRLPKNKMIGFGPDVNNESFPQLFAMGCHMANALRGEGIRSVYRSLPFAYYYMLRQAGKLPKFWLTIRMLSLLPKFAAGKRKRVGPDLIPPFMLKVGSRAKAFAEFEDRGGHRTHCGLPLSFVPEIDAYWLGDSYVDVFGYLGKELAERLVPMSYAEFEDDRPFECESESSLMGTFRNHIKNKDWLWPATLFFALFFPDRLRQVVDPDKSYGMPYTADAWLRFLGDTMQFAPERIYHLFIQGMNAVYQALGQRGVDITGCSLDVLK